LQNKGIYEQNSYYLLMLASSSLHLGTYNYPYCSIVVTLFKALSKVDTLLMKVLEESDKKLTGASAITLLITEFIYVRVLGSDNEAKIEVVP
jgi:hypothetical protein